jgi:hypothetical protein
MFLIKITFFRQQKHSFLGVFLNLRREKTVKYFSISMVLHDIKPMISQTKKTELSIMNVAYFAREVQTFEKKRL